LTRNDSQPSTKENMTIDQIHQFVRTLKPVSRRQVCRYLKEFNIAPSGHRQRPQQFPPESGGIILTKLGFGRQVEALKEKHLGELSTLKLQVVTPGARNTGTAWKTRRAELPTMDQLRAERKKARGGK
jgi:hypothetical protein